MTTADLRYTSMSNHSFAAAISDTEAEHIEQLSGDVTLALMADADQDDCLAAAAELASEVLALEGWNLSPRWEDDAREYVCLTVPAWSLHAARGVGSDA